MIRPAVPDAPPGLGNCLRRLLDDGSVSRENAPEPFRLITKHRELATQVLAATAAMKLHLEDDTYALRHEPAAPDVALAPKWLSEGQAGRGLAMFLYVMWYAEQSTEHGAVLSELATAVQAEARDTGVDFDWTRRDDRRLLQKAIEYIGHLGYAVFREGSAEEWADETGVNDLLLEWRPSVWPLNPPLSGDVRAGLLDPGVELPTAVEFVPRPGPKVRLYRWLLCHPILLRDVDAEAFELLLDSTVEWEVTTTLERFFGLSLDRDDTFARTRVIAADTQAQRTTPMNVQSHSTQVAILLAAAIRERVTAGDPSLAPVNGNVRVTRAFLETLLLDLREKFGAKWKIEFREGPISRVSRSVVPKMLRLGMAVIPSGDENSDEIVITSAAAPYVPVYVNGEKNKQC